MINLKVLNDKSKQGSIFKEWHFFLLINEDTILLITLHEEMFHIS